MSVNLEHECSALEIAGMALIQEAANAGHDGDVLYQAQINLQQAVMWLRKALGAEPPVPEEAASTMDHTPPPEDALYAECRTHNGVDYWWRWRDKQWVTFNELPSDSQEYALLAGRTVC